MTATAPSATRANREGDPCPPWCTDHHPDGEIHRTDRTEFDFFLPGLYAWITVTGIDYCAGGGPGIALGGWHQEAGKPDERTSPYANVSPEDAGQLAGLIEILARATPDQHRELAAAIRQAAAQITGAVEQPAADDRGQLIGNALIDIAREGDGLSA